MRRKALLILFGALALVQLRTLHVKEAWMYVVPIVPMTFSIVLIFKDFRVWRQKRIAERNLREADDD